MAAAADFTAAIADIMAIVFIPARVIETEEAIGGLAIKHKSPA